jgi:NAD-dependent deacetylase
VKAGTELAVVVLTGAGISADSGVATFRGAGGLWEGHRIEDVATPEAWRRAPELVWRFYQLRRAALRTVEPNPAHRALVELERRLAAAGARFTLVTQNVDDLHELAGSRNLLHMHGELAVLRCEHCDERVHDREHLEPHAFVACPTCGHARLRPDVVWFGEMPYHMDSIERALERCTHFLAVGTSGVVYPAAGFLQLARECGARTWVQALERPENVHRADTFVPGRASEVLPALLEGWGKDWSLPPASG